MLGIELLAALTAVTASAANDQPLAKSDEGFVQCYEPNDITKTCQSIAAYKKNENGTWDNVAIVLIAPDEPISLETVTPVRVKDAEVCGYLRGEDVLKGKLRVSGQVVPDEKAAPILAQIVAGMAPMLNKEICTAYVQGQNGLLAKGRIEGQAAPVPDQRVRWVLPAEGYTVAPKPAAGNTNVSGG